MKQVSRFTIQQRRWSFSKRIRAEVWQLMADLTQSGMSISDALMTSATVYKQRGKRQVWHILLDLRAAIARNELRTVAALYAPGGETLLLANFGEADTHRLFEGMARIARADLLISRAITQAVAGPVIIFGVLTGILYMAGAQLFPAFLELTPIEAWPGVSKPFGMFTMWFANSGYVIALVFAALFAAVSVAVPTYTGRWRTKLDRLPPFSFYKLRIGASFLFAIVEAGRTGQQINSSFLFKMAQNSSLYARNRITTIGSLLNSMPIGAATIKAQQDFPARDLNTILVAFSAQENWLENLAKFTDRWLEDVELEAKRSAGLLNVLLMSLAATAIGLLITSTGLCS